MEVVQTLLDAGADVHARDSAGGTALHAATLRRHVDVARALLEAGSDCNAIDQGNNTPLHMLASASAGEDGEEGVAGGVDANLVALLLDWGASVDIKNSKGLTPMSAALDARNRSTVLAYRTFFGEGSVLPPGLCTDTRSCEDFISGRAAEDFTGETTGKILTEASMCHATTASSHERHTATA